MTESIELTLDAFQTRVGEWLTACLGPERALDRTERTHRVLEEVIELAQACGCSEEDALELVRYVYARPPGSVDEEVGGVMVTVAGLCGTFGVNLAAAAEAELERDWERMDRIRAKAAKRRPGSPLPQ